MHVHSRMDAPRESGWAMPPVRRSRREATEDWEQLRLYAAWPQQLAYELLRPIVLFGRTPAARAAETGVPERTLRRHPRAIHRRVRVGRAAHPCGQGPPPHRHPLPRAAALPADAGRDRVAARAPSADVCSAAVRAAGAGASAAVSAGRRAAGRSLRGSGGTRGTASFGTTSRQCCHPWEWRYRPAM